MRAILVALAVLLAGCSGSTPTAPSPIVTPPPVVVTPPPVVTPPVILPPDPPFPPTDPRFDVNFYRQFVHDGLESPNALQPLRRHGQAPFIYVFNHDDAGAPIDSVTLNLTAAALANTAGSLTGVFGLAGLEIGPSPAPDPSRVSIYVTWSSVENPSACGQASISGRNITLYPKTPRCRCDGNPATVNMTTVKHELGHALGYWHTDGRDDLMHGRNFGECDKNPSAREIYHARVAYGRPVGSPPP